ncbi:hypothetical protein N656DRAFT_785236 [Canariomyces notabilis]|uniref:Uncharacterized protein n=1 Tax=Canariomyces notabilis TaxID=2074819 RepID=A0AAN6T6Y8_9PEZI|nr:hypothetical protein N656DRAFT_785236 [Canariomyces arenarius]
MRTRDGLVLGPLRRHTPPSRPHPIRKTYPQLQPRPSGRPTRSWRSDGSRAGSAIASSDLSSSQADMIANKESMETDQNSVQVKLRRQFPQERRYAWAEIKERSSYRPLQNRSPSAEQRAVITRMRTGLLRRGSDGRVGREERTGIV